MRDLIAREDDADRICGVLDALAAQSDCYARGDLKL